MIIGRPFVRIGLEHLCVCDEFSSAVCADAISSLPGDFNLMPTMRAIRVITQDASDETIVGPGVRNLFDGHECPATMPAIGGARNCATIVQLTIGTINIYTGIDFG